MTSKPDRKRRTDAEHALSTIYPSQVEAARILADDDPATLAALTATVLRIAGDAYGGDLAEHAAIIAPSFHRDGQDVLKTARAAVRRARSVVETARTLAEADTYGDLVDLVDLDLDTRSPLASQRQGTHGADECATTRPADLLDTARSLAPVPVLNVLRMVEGHGADCGQCAGTGRRVTAPGLAAHLAGVGPADSRYHRMRRETVAAMRTAPTLEDVCRALGDPAPLATRPTRSHAATIRTPGTTEHPEHVGPVTVRTRDGETVTRDLTDAERVAVETRAAHERRHDGEEYGVSTAPSTDVDARGMVRSRKPVVSPRKRAAGSTGPTIPVTLGGPRR